MNDQALYEDDILAWSEQQAAAIRRLGQRGRVVPNDLDVENVAEEIESVGRSELAAVESQLRLIFVHLIKLCMEPSSDAVRHWRSEIFGFYTEARGRYTPSMRRRIDLDAIWRSAREQAMIAYDEVPRELAGKLPTACPFTLDELLADRIDILALQARLAPDAK